MVRITKHCLDMYRERVDSSAQITDLLTLYLKSKASDLRQAERKKNKKKTTYVVNSKCIFIVSGKNVVTVITKEQAKLRDRKSNVLRKGMLMFGLFGSDRISNENDVEYNRRKEALVREWNAAIEEAIQICNAYDRGFSTDAGMIKLKIMELKK